jgi:hypothetical protein
MTKRVVVIATIFAILIIYPNSINAGAWVREKGEIIFPLQVYYYQTDYAFDSDGRLEKKDGIF